jgi:putative membrane protein
VQTSQNNKYYRILIIALSVLIPLVVAALFRVKIDMQLPVFLPPVYAGINALTSLVLISSLWAVKNKKVKLHELLMKVALALSALFLILYVLYHMTAVSTPYRGEGILRPVYYFILISHILLSLAVVPIVLITFLRGITGDFEKHKKIARYAFPLWLYVAVTGVLVYLMISPYYAQ